jgi:hypothetical protein
MWEAMAAASGVLGGAVWSGIDDVFVMPDGPTVGYGTWGPLDGWRRPKPEYWHLKKVYSPIRPLASVIPLPAGDRGIEIELENRHDFTDAAELNIAWALDDGRRGRVSAAVPPRSRGRLRIPVQGEDLEGRWLELSFSSPQGFEIDRFRLPIGQPPPPPGPSAQSPPLGPLRLEKHPELLRVTGANFDLEVDARTGKIRRLFRGGKTLLGGGPELLLLPLNGEGGTQMTADSQTFAPFTPTCENWSADCVEAEHIAGRVNIRVTGSYRQAAGGYTLSVSQDGGLEVDARFICREAVDPRQIGMVFSVPRALDTLSWSRRGLWTVYPEDHIGRAQGRATAFPGPPPSGPAGPRTPPSWPWADDTNALGSRDFRSTKSNIYWAALTDREGKGVAVLSDGSQHVRSWVDGDSIKWLTAEYSNAGAERFFVSHARNGYRPLSPGSTVRLRIRLLPFDSAHGSAPGNHLK